MCRICESAESKYRVDIYTADLMIFITICGECFNSYYKKHLCMCLKCKGFFFGDNCGQYNNKLFFKRCKDCGKGEI